MKLRQLSAALLLAAAIARIALASPAASSRGDQVLDLRGEHLLTTPLIVPAQTRLRGPARLRAAPRADLAHLVELREGATIEDIDLQGTGLAAPTPAWTEEAGAPRGVGVVIAGTADAPLRGAHVLRCRFTDFPGGGVFARHTANVVLEDLQADHMHQAAQRETCAVFAFYDSTESRIIGCRIADYRWKGFYFKHCTKALARDDFAVDGPPDHASHYARFSQVVTFVGGGATAAFGVKTFGSERVRVEGMTFERATTGIFIDATAEADVLRNRISDSVRQGIIIGSEEGFLPTSGVRVRENVVVTNQRDTTPNSSGVQLVALGPGRPVTAVEISENEIAGYLWGISFLPGAGLTYDEVTISGNRLTALRQYGVVGPVHHLRLHRNRIELHGSLAEDFVAVWPANPDGSAIELIGNIWIGPRDFGLELGRPEAKFSRVTVQDNRHTTQP